MGEPLSDWQRKAISDHIAAGNRDTVNEPVFVGRGDVLGEILGSVRAALEGAVQGRTMVLYGPPGIGKTAVLTELSRRSKESLKGEGEGKGFLAVPVSVNKLNDYDALLARFVDAARGAPGGMKAWSRIKSGLKALSRRGFSVGAGFGISPEGPPQRLSLDGFQNEVGKVLDALPHCGAALLLVDEAQALRGADGEPGGHCPLLSELQGHANAEHGSKPILPVLAGLTDLPDKLGKSISGGHFAEGHLVHLRALSHSESVDYGMGILEHFGLTGGESSRLAVADWAASESSGWPRHLHGTMAAWLHGHLRCGCADMGSVDRRTVEGKLVRDRKEYYEGRVPVRYRKATSLLANVLRKMEEVRPRGEEAASNVVLAEVRMADRNILEWFSQGEQWSAHKHASLLWDAMVERGLIARSDPDDEGLWAVPIHSMITYLETGGYVPDTPAPDFRAEAKPGVATKGISSRPKP